MEISKFLLTLPILLQFAVADIDHLTRVTDEQTIDPNANIGGELSVISKLSDTLASQVPQIVLPTPEPSPRILADVNGDGNADAIGFGSLGVGVALSNGTGFDKASLWLNDFGYNQGWRSDKTLRKMVDVNNDGLADIVGFGYQGVRVALSNGTGFDKASLWLNDFGYNQGWHLDRGIRIMADVNGDGMADIVAFGNNGVSVALSSGSDFNNAQRWVDDFGYKQGWRNDRGLRMMADVNGDKKADIVAFGNNGISVALSSGNSFINAQRWVDDFGYNQGWRNDRSLRYMSDINGDGKVDIVAFGNNGVSVAISNGNSFVNAKQWTDDFGYSQGWRNEKDVRIMADVNGDKKKDIVAFGNNGVSVALSNGYDFSNTRRWIDAFSYNKKWRNNKHLRVMADVNGDGYADVVGFGDAGTSVSISTGSDFDQKELWLNDFGYGQGWRVNFTPYQNGTPEPFKHVKMPYIPKSYTKFPAKAGAHALTNNGEELVYGAITGLMYGLDIKTGKSTFIYDLNRFIPDILIGGLVYTGGSRYYYSGAHKGTINYLDTATDTSREIVSGIFPDGIELYNNKIYSITNDRYGVLTIYDTDGNELGTLSTGIDDIVAIAHTDKYLYILSEDGDVYQVNPRTGNSRLAINNSGFTEGDSFGGLEGIDIFKNYIYMTNVDDSTIYRVDLDIRSIE